MTPVIRALENAVALKVSALDLIDRMLAATPESLEAK